MYAILTTRSIFNHVYPPLRISLFRGHCGSEIVVVSLSETTRVEPHRHTHTTIQENIQFRTHFTRTHGTMTSPKDFTPIEAIAPLVEKMRQVSFSKKTHSLEWRKTQLRAILRMMDDEFDVLAQAVKEDFGQSPNFIEIFEYANAKNMARCALDNMEDWMKPERVATPFPVNMTQPVYSEVRTTDGWDLSS